MDPIELVSTLTQAMKSVDINHQDEFGETTLHRAALRGATVCAMHLLQVN
jgi:ankyrin repeat protein